MSNCAVAILLATKDGAEYLEAQLNSFSQQSITNWSLYVSDDGSWDSTLRIVETFKRHVRQPVAIRQGPKLGFCENFMSLARDRRIRADYYAFSDQDDIWMSNKLERAIDRVTKVSAGTPALYCSRTELIDKAATKAIGMSPLFVREPSFRNALVQNIGGGNTMVFN